MLTFFVWADMHFGYRPAPADRDFRVRTLRQMNDLAGRPYPPEVGGCVEDPSMILVCGDFVNGGSDGVRNFGLYRDALRQSELPSYEAMGNHDLPYGNVVDYFRQRYGDVYYSFDHQGVHFVALCQTFDELERVQAMDAPQLAWLEQDLASLAEETPVIVFAHDDLDKQPNADDIFRVLSRSRVILTLSGHIHGRQSLDGCTHDWNGITVATTGHVRDHPIDMDYGRTILVVRIAGPRMAIVPWRWDLGEWARRQHNGDAPGHTLVTLRPQRSGS